MTMSSIAQKIHYSHLVTDIFNSWPSFHDAEVISIEMQRELNGSEPNVVARIYLFEITPEVDDHGYYVLRDHVIVTFAFKGIDESLVKSFNQQNVLRELSIIDISSRQLENLRFAVHFSSSFGVEAEFKCTTEEVLSVEKTDPPAYTDLTTHSPPIPRPYNL